MTTFSAHYIRAHAREYNASIMGLSEQIKYLTTLDVFCHVEIIITGILCYKTYRIYLEQFYTSIKQKHC